MFLEKLLIQSSHNMKTFIAHLHPLLVHLPIGILLVYILLEFLRRNEKYKLIEPINKLLFFIGIASALLSIITGLLNAELSTYPEHDIFWHKWTAIGTTLLFIVYYLLRNNITDRRLFVFSFYALLLVSISATGHLGGVLTHGENYLSFEVDDQPEIKPLQIQNMQEAMVYEDLVQYIFDKNCISCHGAQKQKGELRLDEFQYVLTGGKSGKIIQSGELNKSEIIRRILLDDSDEKHMPPKGKLPLRDFEIQLLKWWIQSGAANQQKVREMSADSITINAIKQFHQTFSQNPKPVAIERPPIKPLDPSIIKELQSIGFTITPLSINENYYRVVAYNVKDSINKALGRVQKIAPHIIELKLSFTKADDATLQLIPEFVNIEKLWLDHTEIGTAKLNSMTSLKNLKYLNLYKTNIQKAELESINFSKELQIIYPAPKDTLLIASDTTLLPKPTQ